MKKVRDPKGVESLPVFNDSILQPAEDEILRAIMVRPLNEFRFRDYCDKSGIVNYLPLRKTWKIHNIVRKDKSYTYTAEVLRPMFSSYVFVKARLEDLRSLYDSDAILKILQPPSQAQFLEELRTIRIAEEIGFHQEIEVHKDIPEGSRFLIQSGPWEGVTGWLSKKDGVFKWTIALDVCDQRVTATIDPTQYKMTPLE